MPQDLFTRAAAARYVGVDTYSVDRRRQKKGYAQKEVGGVKFFERWWLDEWKDERSARAFQKAQGSEAEVPE